MRGEDPVHQSSFPVRADLGRRGPAAAPQPLSQLLLAVRRPGDTVGVLDERHDQGQPREQQGPVPGDAEPLLERIREERLDGDQAGEDRPGDHRDPADVGECDQAERGQGREPAHRHRAEVVPVERAADPGDERADPERRELDVADVDAGGRRRSLVRPNRQHSLSERRAAEIRHEQPEQRPSAQRRRTRTRGSARCRRARERGRTGPRSSPNSLGSGTGELEVPPPQVELRKTNCSIATAAASVTTARLTPRTRSAETADRRGRPPSRTQRADQHAERKADAVVGGEMRDREAGDAGEGELDDGDLADEAGDHDDRQAHDRRQERRDQRLAEVVRQDDQRDDAPRSSRAAPAARAALRAERAGAAARRARHDSAGSCRGRTSRRPSVTNTSSGWTPGSATPLSVGNQLWIWR